MIESHCFQAIDSKAFVDSLAIFQHFPFVNESTNGDFLVAGTPPKQVIPKHSLIRQTLLTKPTKGPFVVTHTLRGDDVTNGNDVMNLGGSK